MRGKVIREAVIAYSRKSGTSDELVELKIGDEISFGLENLTTVGSIFLKLPGDGRVKKEAISVTAPETLDEIEYLDKISEKFKAHKKILVITHGNHFASRCFYFEDELLIRFPGGSRNFENRALLLTFALDLAEEEGLEIQILESFDSETDNFLLTDYEGTVLTEGNAEHCFNYFKNGGI